LIFYSICCKL
jgi:serine/threonine-protein phosphatase 4 regulatory subunit 2